MRVGSLVRDIRDPEMIGIVQGRQGVTTRWYIKWLTGYWQGQVVSRWHKQVEVLCE